MSDIDPPKPEIVNPMQELWDLYRQTGLAKGFDFGEILAAWTTKEQQRLASPGARDDFDQLCKAGCVPQVLALIIAIIRFSPQLSEFFEVLLGNPDKREKTLRSLERASEAFQDLFGNLLTRENEDLRTKLTEMGHIPPSRLVSGIHFYAQILKGAEAFADVEVNSLAELTKYLLVGYVERATGTFCDRNVSGLIGEIVGPVDHNEVAQRMWRYRNYQRLKKNFQGLPELLFDLSFVVALRT
jgi:hypothetical protein